MRPGGRILLEIGGDESVAHGDPDRLGPAGQRQQQRYFIGEPGGDGDLILREHQHAVVCRMLRIGALPIREGRSSAHGVARHVDRHRPERQPSGDDRVRLGRRLERQAPLRGLANQAEELLTARVQARRIRQITLPLDESARALERMPGEECRLATQPIVILGEIRGRGHGDRIQFADRAGAVAIRHVDLGGDECPRSGQRGARLRGDRRVLLLGRGDVARENPLLRAQQLVPVPILGRLRGQIRIRAGRIGMLAVLREALRPLRARSGGGSIRLDQAAAGRSQGERALSSSSRSVLQVILQRRGRSETAAIPCIPRFNA